LSTVNVSTSTQLVSALSSAQAGETIALEPGTYDPITLTKLKLPSGVTITSADPANQAVLTGVYASGCSGLTFTGLTFSTAATPIGPFGPATTFSFYFNHCRDLTLTDLNVVGTPGVTLANATSGIKVDNSSSTYITNNTFSWLHYGIEHDGDSGLIITGNNFSYLYDDGIRGGGSSYVNVVGNTFTSMHMDPTDTDHPDCIQFWTVVGESGSNIKVSNNTYVRGDGNPIQGIFFEDSIGGIPFQNVTITNNSITGGGFNGITAMGVGDSIDNLTMNNNIVTEYADQASFITVYNVNKGVVSFNTAPEIKTSGDVNVKFSNDSKIVPSSMSSAAADIIAGSADPGPDPGASSLAAAAFASHIAAMPTAPLSWTGVVDTHPGGGGATLARPAVA
jgi:hypothetical protein